MAQQPQQQQNQGGDSAYGPIWIIVGLFVAGYAVWYFFKAQIVGFVFSINLFEAKIVSLFTNGLDKDISFMELADPTTVTFEQVKVMTREVGSYLKYPVCALFISLATILYFSNIKLKFRRTHSMKTLREQEKNNWPQITPVTQTDLVSEDIRKGPWAMALSPMEFAKKYQLLKKDDFAAEDPRHPGIPITATIKKGETKGVFTVQMGAYFKGVQQLPIHLAALCAVFAARANQDRTGAHELLDSINRSTLLGKINFAGSVALLKKHMNINVVQEVASKHAYELTFMASMLVAARNDGVLASCDFLWLKTVDRRAWFLLNSIGRQTPFAEAAAAYAHWKAECALGRRCMVPMVDEAITALELAIKEVKMTPQELEAI